MAAVLDTAPDAATDFMSVRGVCEYAGITKNAVFNAINRRRLHPLRVAGSTRFLLLRSEVLAWRHRYTWRPTPEEVAALMASGYKLDDFTPATPGEPTTPLGEPYKPPSAPTGGAAEASSAFVSPADVLAYIQVLSQSATTGAAAVGGEVAERTVRPFAEALRDGATLDVGAVTRAAGDVAVSTT